MNAAELHTKLSSDLSAKQSALGSLRAERIKLVLPAHEGDGEAMLRLQDIRSDVAAIEAGIGDLVQAIADLQPAVEAEAVAARLEARERLYVEFRAASAAMLVRLAALDAGIEKLAESYEAVMAPINRVRALAVELLCPMTQGCDVSAVSQSRMAAMASVNVGLLSEQFDRVLSARLARRRPADLGGVFADAVASVDARLLDALKHDRAAARRLAGPVEVMADAAPVSADVSVDEQPADAEAVPQPIQIARPRGASRPPRERRAYDPHAFAGDAT